MIPMLCGLVMFGLGLFMTICPKQATKKDQRDDENAVAKNRNAGIVLIVLGILLELMSFFLIYM